MRDWRSPDAQWSVADSGPGEEASDTPLRPAETPGAIDGGHEPWHTMEWACLGSGHMI